jgi:predicted transcriptional regulator
MKTGFRKALDKSFEQSREAITRRLKQSNRGNVYTNLVEELRKKYNIKVNKDKIASIGKIPKIDGIKNQENVASK